MFYVRKRNDGLRKWFDDFIDFPVAKGEMKTDVKEDNDKYTFEIEVPGITKDDIKLSVENEYLNVEVTKEVKTESKEKDNFIIRERQFGSLNRSYYIGNVEEANIKANYVDGILSIIVPKAEETEKKFIAIE